MEKRSIKKGFLFFIAGCSSVSLISQDYLGKGNATTLPPLPVPTKIERIDLDKDGDPDVIKGYIFGNVPIIWIDDDDDMTWTDVQGDLDSDCMLVDRDRDGLYTGPYDFAIDRIDEDKDGKADLEANMVNYDKNNQGFDWEADYYWAADLDKDGAFRAFRWDSAWIKNVSKGRVTLGWAHDGNCAFYTDYMGKTFFTKMSASSHRIADLRYSWENPFLFYDYDDDGYSESAVRLVDTPILRSDDASAFAGYPDSITILFTNKIGLVQLAYDLDNNNGVGNEFDFDMSMEYAGPGFDYSNQVHPIRNNVRETAADNYFTDLRWRKLTELIYADHDSALNLVYRRGNWQSCSFVFDEDNDCKRWERVEFYKNEPSGVFKINTKGSLDGPHSSQADAAGDRGEWDSDYSGKGKLYIGKFDGLIHLFGAEWGCWRMDPFAESFQGYGGLYDNEANGGWVRNQTIPARFATVKYMDTDNNGFFDKIQFDMDSDKVMERTVSLAALSISDVADTIRFDTMNYESIRDLFSKVALSNWKKAQEALVVAAKNGIDTTLYDFLNHPVSLRDKYYSGYWLNYNIYRDLQNMLTATGRAASLTALDKAYFSREWDVYTTGISSSAVKALPLVVSPNPVGDTLNIKIQVEKAAKYRVILYDMNGKVLINKLVDGCSVSMDVRTIKKGIYNIYVESNANQRIMTKFIKG